MTFKESLFTPSSGRGPCVSSAKRRPALALTPGPASRPASLGKAEEERGAGEGLLGVGGGVVRSLFPGGQGQPLPAGRPGLASGPEQPARRVCCDLPFHTLYVLETLS